MTVIFLKNKVSFFMFNGDMHLYFDKKKSDESPAEFKLKMIERRQI